MLLGHIGVALAVKRVAPEISLPILLPLSFAPDILGLPNVLFPNKVIDLVPWTHGLVATCVLALLSFLIAALVSRRAWYGFVIGLVVFSHWVLDFVAWPVFGRGLPVLLNGSPEIGLGLYSTTAGRLIGEAAGLLFVVVMIISLARSSDRKKEDKRLK
jgi:hypothetical protein